MKEALVIIFILGCFGGLFLLVCSVISGGQEIQKINRNLKILERIGGLRKQAWDYYERALSARTMEELEDYIDKLGAVAIRLEDLHEEGLEEDITETIDENADFVESCRNHLVEVKEEIEKEDQYANT